MALNRVRDRSARSASLWAGVVGEAGSTSDGGKSTGPTGPSLMTMSGRQTASMTQLIATPAQNSPCALIAQPSGGTSSAPPADSPISAIASGRVAAFPTRSTIEAEAGTWLNALAASPNIAYTIQICKAFLRTPRRGRQTADTTTPAATTSRSPNRAIAATTAIPPQPSAIRYIVAPMDAADSDSPERAARSRV